jgi:NAD(P)-dependent dehydrogenase (short-subunit alcohol dehydrogenase family)
MQLHDGLGFASRRRPPTRRRPVSVPHLDDIRALICHRVGERDRPGRGAAAGQDRLTSLTRTLSRVLAPEVRVNAVAPGWIAGEWMRRTLGENYDRLMERRATWTPMQRNVTAADVAETIYSLAAANPFVTGETIVIDGGYAATT